MEPIFSNIVGLSEITKSIQNYVKLAFKYNKQCFVPSNFIELIINSISQNGISEQAEICLRSYGADKLSDANRALLANKAKELINYLHSRLQYGGTDITNTISNINLCLKLVYQNDFAKEVYLNVMTQLYSVLERLKTTADTTRKQYAYDLLLEMFWFIDDDNKFSNLLTQYISSNKDLFILKIMI